MANNQKDPRAHYDALEAFPGGVNEGLTPLELPRTVLSRARNCTVRGGYVTHRPPYQKRALTFESDDTKNRFKTGLFQAATFYKPDNAPEALMAAISGDLFKLEIVLDTVTVTRVNGAETQDATVDQHWLWQTEKWVVWNDAIHNPVFYDNTTAVRSNFSQPVNFNTLTTAVITVPALNTVTPPGNYFAVANLNVGDIVTIQNVGTMQVMDNAAGAVVLLNLTCTQTGFQVPVGTTVSWTHLGTQLPPGRMGVYVLNRNWMSLPDARQFVASDGVGGASGTVAENYRDAVLNITENNYLAGGGNFIVPGSAGDITAMRATAILDTQMGQGPLQVFVPTKIFSVNTPVERQNWQDITNPILTEPLITNGAKGQDSTQLANGDIIFRSIDGLRSEILGRRDFNTWGNTPISFEMDPIFNLDDPGLLRFGSAVVFDNRRLDTVGPVSHEQGVYWRGLVALNFDPVSSLRGKAPSIFDGLWTGLNIFNLVLGQFNDVERCFAFVLNTSTDDPGIELWELLKDGVADDKDGTLIPIEWSFRSASLRFGQTKLEERKVLQLNNGEIQIDELVGTVDFEASYFPDQWPCPVPWFNWQECQIVPAPENSPGFRPRMGLGEPDIKPCDPSNDRPLRDFFTFQFELSIRGHCRFLGAKFKAIEVAEVEFAKPICTPLCPQ